MIKAQATWLRIVTFLKRQCRKDVNIGPSEHIYTLHKYSVKQYWRVSVRLMSKHEIT